MGRIRNLFRRIGSSRLVTHPWSRRGRRIASVVLLLLGVWWAVEWFVLPMTVRYVVGEILEGIGFPNARFAVRYVSLNGAEFTDVRAGGNAAPVVDVLFADYSPWSVLHGRIRVLRFVGARVVLDLDLPNLGREPSETPTRGSAGGSLPVDRIELSQSTFIVTRGKGRIAIPVYGAADNGSCGLNLDVNAILLGALLKLKGTVDPATAAVDVTGDLQSLDVAAALDAALSVIPPASNPLPDLRAGGRFSALAHLRLHTPADGLDVTLRPEKVWAARFAPSVDQRIDGVNGTLSARLDANWRPVAADAQFAVQSLSSGTSGARDVELNLGVEAASGAAKVVRLRKGSGIAVGSLVSAGTTVGKPASTQPFVSVSTSDDSVLQSDGEKGSPGQLPKLLLRMAPLGAAGGANVSGLSAVLDAEVTHVANNATDLHVHLASASPVSFRNAQAGADLASFDLSGDVRFGGGTAPSAAGVLQLKGGVVQAPSRQLTAGDISASIPLAWHREQDGAGSWKVGSIRRGPTTLPSVGGTLAVRDAHVTFTAASPDLPGAALKVDATATTTSGGNAAANVHLSLPSFKISDPATVARLIPAAQGYDVTATLAADGDVRWADGRLVPNLKVKLSDGHVASADKSTVIDGVGADVTIDGFSPLATPGGQTLTAKSVKLSKAQLADVGVRFRVESADSILIEQARCAYAGGSLETDAFRLDPAKKAADLTVYADGINVGPVLDDALSGKATGQGKLYAKVPVSIRWPTIGLGQGFVYSAPGPGELKLGQASADVVGGLLDREDPRFKTDDSYKRLKQDAIEALRDFQYDLFQVDVYHDATGGLTASIRLRGKGKTVQTLQGFNLNINVTGLDVALKDVTRISNVIQSIGQP